jgi:putative ABC transport system permease protein
MALGAPRNGVLWLILRQILGVVGVGTVVGLGLALAMSRLLQSMLYELKPADPVAFSVAAIVLLGAATAAVYFPARQAARVDPMVTLRYE